MRKLFCILFLFFSLALMAQEKKTSTKNGQSNWELQQENKKLEKENSDLKKQFEDSLKIITTLRHRLSNKSTEIEKLKSDTSSLNKKLTQIKDTLKKTNKMLVTNALNFLYIPYEAWSIDSVAIPAFNAISDLSLKEEYKKEEQLLKNFHQDVEAVVSFLTEVENEMKKNKIACDLQKLKKQMANKDFYKRYTAKEKFYKSYYLGRKIKTIEKELENSNPNITSIRNELDQCLKTK